MNRSLSSVILLKKEVPTVQAQYSGQRTLRHGILPAGRSLYYIDDSKVKVSSHKFNTTPRSTDLCETMPPCLREKRVRFSERVQQCISLDSPDEYIDGISTRRCNYDTIHGINMAFINRKRQSATSRDICIRNQEPRSTLIAKLPATALKGSRIDVSRQYAAMKKSVVIPTKATTPSPSAQAYRRLGTQQAYSYYFNEDLDGHRDGDGPVCNGLGSTSRGYYKGLEDPNFSITGYGLETRLYTNSVNTPDLRLSMDSSQWDGGTSSGGGGIRAVVDAIDRACGIVRDVWGVLLNRYW